MITTQRLTLRRWREDDLEPFAALNADPLVMEYFPKTLSHDESEILAGRIARHFEQYGFGWWSTEITANAVFIGLVGLSVPRFEAHFTPCVEIGWRLARGYWGQGYASEAARAALAYGFEKLQLEQIVSLTVPANRRSRAVMERIGMVRDRQGDFEHPHIDEGHPLRRHVLYRMTRQDWIDR
jgi:RimJ/RimL family protein N-acetyltransferase